MTSPRFIFHLLPNAHLDPVWLWDWREGLNEGVITIRTILDLMDEFPQLTFIRGESSIYEHVEKTDPATFERIRAMVGTGRWDIVGGTYNQPDTNLAAVETLCRQYERGLSYFQSRFNFRPRIAWQADSFGHTPGLPNVFSAFGIEGFAFTRPGRGQFPMQQPAFWWQGDGGNKILCYRQHFSAYCSERGNIGDVLNLTLEQASPLSLVHVGVLMGLGNHGGGPSRRHLREVEQWAKEHPDVEVRFSTLHRFFDALHEEVREQPESAVPTLRGDMGYCLRGCYSSVMKVKAAYRHSEEAVASADSTQAIISAALKTPTRPLDEAWDGAMFNSFHDILPGSSIERAMEDQLALAGLTIHQASDAKFRAMNHLAMQVDTSVGKPEDDDHPTDVPIFVWNSLSRPFQGWVELEASMDYRPLWGSPAGLGTVPLSLIGPGGVTPAFQEIETENHSIRDVAWRKRVVVKTEIPAYGWQVFRLGYRSEKAPAKLAGEGACQAISGDSPSISNNDWNVSVTADKEISVSYRGRSLFGNGNLTLRTFDDIWGSWGGMQEEEESYLCPNLRDQWSITQTAILEEGPERAALWTRWTGGNSWIDLTFHVLRETPYVQVKARLLWNERSARLKLILPSSGELEMEVPASKIKREQKGHLPCGRWIRRGDAETGLALVSDVLSDVDAIENETRLTVARASRYADDVPTKVEETPWLPAVDCGELKFEFWLMPPSANLEKAVEELLQPPVSVPVPSHPGTLKDEGSLAKVTPAEVRVLSAARTEKGIRVRVQNRSDAEVQAVFTLQGRDFELGALKPYEIKTAEFVLES